MFLTRFRIFYLVYKQAYKLELYRKKSINNVFSKAFLKQDIIGRGQVNKVLELESNIREDK